jgi:hypothetical protein
MKSVRNLIFAVVFATSSHAMARNTIHPRPISNLVSAPRQMLTEKEAFKRVEALPEFTRFVANLKKASHGRVDVIEGTEASPLPGCKAGTVECRFELYVGENHPDHTAVWERFYVDAWSGAISVYDVVTDAPISLAEWRTLSASGFEREDVE